MINEVNNATCSICGKPYHLCQSCKDTISLNPWKLHTDTADHYVIYQIIHGYSTGVYSKEIARDKLKNANLTDLNSFRNNIQSVISEIMQKDKIDNKIEVEDEVIDIYESIPIKNNKNRKNRK